MARKLDPMSPDEVRDAADRAEGVKPEKRERPGQPTAYKDSYAKQAAKLCALGATDDDLASFFEVSRQTISNWKSAHEEFFYALKGGKDEADDRVERSLYQRALGYSHDAVKILQNNGEPVIVPYTEHYPPDTTACIFWLKNRRPDLWRDKTEVLHRRDATMMTDDELARIARGGGSGVAEAPERPSKPH